MRKPSLWEDAGQEPPVSDLLSDPIIQLLMQADGVTIKDVIEAIDAGTAV
jgi:hypothetical protein